MWDRKYCLNIISGLLLTVVCIVSSAPGYAAPLPDDTLLSLDPGVLSGSSGTDGCASGSCVGYEEQPGSYIWYVINPGTDGGIVIGRNQVCGDQNNNASSTAPGEITAADPLFFVGGIPATFCTTPMTGSSQGVVTSDASANFFDANSCAGAGCIGITQLGTWHVAWNQVVAPLGSAGGCQSGNCSVDQLAGIDVSNWLVTSNPDNTVNYQLDYSWVIPGGDPSGFGGVKLRLHLAGDVVTPAAPQLSGIWKSSIVDVLFIFGENLTNITELLVNGVNLTNSINPVGTDHRMILALAPGLKAPFTVSITTTDGVAVFPQACP